jgi:hypothetical protein
VRIPDVGRDVNGEKQKTKNKKQIAAILPAALPRSNPTSAAFLLN